MISFLQHILWQTKEITDAHQVAVKSTGFSR